MAWKREILSFDLANYIINNKITTVNIATVGNILRYLYSEGRLFGYHNEQINDLKDLIYYQEEIRTFFKDIFNKCVLVNISGSDIILGTFSMTYEYSLITTGNDTYRYRRVEKLGKTEFSEFFKRYYIKHFFPMLKTERIRICETCNKFFYQKTSKVTRYCDNECYKKRGLKNKNE